LRDRHLAQQQLEWQQQKTSETQLSHREELAALQTSSNLAEYLIPCPVRSKNSCNRMRFSKRLQAMEPVNMLALSEYDRTQTRLDELSQKLVILSRALNC